ncbi:MAG: hypothetical protein ABSC61_02210 [Anaerolineales bacterium]
MDTNGQAIPGIRIVPFLLVIAACLIAGILLGTITGGNLSSPAPTKNPPLTLVFLGYDSIQASTALDSVWVLTLDGNGNADFKGISPALVITTTQGQPAVLRDFLADPLDAPSRMYQLSLVPQPSTSVAFDRQAFSTLVNRLGGVPIDGKYLRGQDLSNLLSENAADPLAVLRTQLRVVKSLFTSGPCLSESALSGLEPEHMLSSLPPDLLVAECKKRGPYFQGAVQFHILDDVIPWRMPDGSIGLLPNG